MRGKHVIIAASALIALCLVAAVLWPRDVARIRCADGWSLVIRTATLGTNHHFVSVPRWHPSLLHNTLLQRAWAKVYDRFQSSSDRLRSIRSMNWKSHAPGIALWGEWDPRAQQSHLLRFDLVDDSGAPVASLTTRMVLSERAGEGLVATCINLPATRHFRVRVFDDANPEEPVPLGEFGL